MKRLAFAFAAVFASVVATLVAVEGALRLADYPPAVFSPWIRAHDTGYQYAPSLSTRMTRPEEFDVAFDTNAEGMRDDELGPKQGVRVLLLGDSFASGYGVERNEMFADLLERELGVEIINAAVGGYEIVHQVRYFESTGSKMGADLVLYALYLGNDLSRNNEWQIGADGALFTRDREFPVRQRHEIKLEWLYKQFRYNRKVAEEQERGDWEPRPDYLAMAERHLSEEAAGDYRDVETLLRKLRDYVRGAGVQLFVAIIPYRTIVDASERERYTRANPGFDDRYDLDLPGVRTGEILERLDIAHFDLSPTLRAQLKASGEPLFFPVDGHLNPRGNQVVAGALAPVLAANLPANPRNSRQ